VFRSFFAVTAAGFAMFLTPGALMMPGGKPVIDVPGERPTLSLSTEGPVLVTVDPAKTEYDSAVARGTVGTSAAEAPSRVIRIAAIDATNGRKRKGCLIC
jgi:hypothetical protein